MSEATFDFEAYDEWDNFNKQIPKLIEDAGSGTAMVHPITILGTDHQLTLQQLRSLWYQLEGAVTKADLMEYIARETYAVVEEDNDETKA